ncbi:3-hydroxyacyl-ACP dehydratase FabZ family protein [Alienimonas californiensis]|uniref:3-hydroxyacyl-[acyl-carrier-protein] dehydratase FabZ n=1 Tax=Alienimonas californiensis TaxID=2527989 RepID=A0A517P8Z5_9PLAN|nr:3-hydroxyacyl-ACP dehydratase FabZ family protein [Alienimonas californiensis]QDT15854.1 3-hydroxyacyl-[acyl-carrier-protein] dehydratase FabZ [Alienimonas californiensis]
MRFNLIDRVTAVRPGESITGVKALTRAEEYLGDHFPGFAVMPGVLMVESMVQASAWLLRITDDFSHANITLAEAKAVKFNSFITPGQTLNVTAEIHKRDGDRTTFKTSGSRDGVTCVSARLTLLCENRADRPGAPSDAAAKDASLRDWYRRAWAEVYAPNAR